MQRMVLSLSMRVPYGLSVHSLSENSLNPQVLIFSTIRCVYTTVSSWWWALEARNMQTKIVFYEEIIISASSW